MVGDLQARLPGYSWVGAGRDDGKDGGELNPIFYRNERFVLQESGTCWLAPDSTIPGRGWDAACPRIVTWARFTSSAPGVGHIVHFNTHFDHFGRRARVESAVLLLERIDAIAGCDPVVVTGDFNCREASRTYGILTGRHAISEASAHNFLRDAYHDSAQPPAGPRRTYRGLLGRLGLGRIDYIFLRNAVRTERYAVLADDTPASDHRPVVADLEVAPTDSP